MLNIATELRTLDQDSNGLTMSLEKKRCQAIKAGEHVISHAEKQIHITAYRNYRKLRQRKQRDFHRDCINKLETAMVNGNHNMWQVLKEICDYHCLSRDGPSSEEIFLSFQQPSGTKLCRLLCRKVWQYGH